MNIARLLFHLDLAVPLVVAPGRRHAHRLKRKVGAGQGRILARYLSFFAPPLRARLLPLVAPVGAGLVGAGQGRVLTRFRPLFAPPRRARFLTLVAPVGAVCRGGAREGFGAVSASFCPAPTRAVSYINVEQWQTHQEHRGFRPGRTQNVVWFDRHVTISMSQPGVISHVCPRD